jgi:hypothetical protein
MHDRSLIAMDRLQWETQSENSSAADVIFHCHAAAVRFHDFLDDRQTQACSFSFAILSPPESLEEMIQVLFRDAASLIQHGYTTVSMDPHRNLPVRRGVGYGIFDKVPDGILYSICIRFDPDRSVRTDEGDCPALGDRPWRHGCDHRARELPDGDILTSYPPTSTVIRISRKTGKILWKLGPPIVAGQHAPTLLENGNVLIFDNGVHRLDDSVPYSRVIEINPSNERDRMEIPGQAELEFFLAAHGLRSTAKPSALQELPRPSNRSTSGRPQLVADHTGPIACCSPPSLR